MTARQAARELLSAHRRDSAPAAGLPGSLCFVSGAPGSPSCDSSPAPSSHGLWSFSSFRLRVDLGVRLGEAVLQSCICDSLQEPGGVIPFASR